MFKPKKSLGQNFLKNESIVDQVVSTAGVGKDDVVLEIGPGQGVLTEKLLEKAGKVIAIEKDKRLIEDLNKKFKGKKFELIEGDVLKEEILDRVRNDNRSYKLVANIPYYITGAILKKFLVSNKKPELMVLMVQKEVAQRIVARGGKESVLSLSVKAFGEPKYIKTVKKENFSPKPKVDSAILLVENISNNNFDSKDEEFLFFEIIKKSFCGKRKKIGNTLKMYREKIEDLGIDIGQRPEDLSLDDWLDITKALSKNLG